MLLTARVRPGQYQEPETRSEFPTWKTETQAPEPSSAAFQVHEQEAGLEALNTQNLNQTL